MQSIKYNWGKISPILKAAISNCGLTHVQLSIASGVSYDAIHRFAFKSIRNYSDNAFNLCKYLDIDLSKYSNMQNIDKLDIDKTIDEVWDGSVNHAELIIELIKSTKKYRIEKR